MSRLRPALAALATTALLTACPSGAPATLEAAPALLLRAYDVPAAHAAEVQNLVSNLLWRSKDLPAVGTVALAPTGQLLVAAPASFHQGMAELSAKLKQAPTAPPPAVQLDYWVVLGTPSAEPSRPEDVAPEVAEALAELLKAQGPMKLALLDRVRLTSLSGDEARMSGARVEVEQSATVLDGKVLAHLDIRRSAGPGRMNARVQIPVGQTLVLGQAGVIMKPDEPLYTETPRGQVTPPVTAFYVVRASAR